MRILGEPDKEYVPQNEIEKIICDLVKSKIGKETKVLWDRSSYPYEDIEGNKIELWEPNDVEYEKIVEGRTK